MQATVEELDGLGRRLTVQVPAETVDKEVQSRLSDLSRRARIDGFRPGKVPVKVVKRMYGNQVRQEVVGEMLQSSFQDAVQQQELRVAGVPSLEPVSLEEGKNLEYRATFEVFPEFQPNDIAGRKITRPQIEIGDSDVDGMLETLRRQRAEWREVEREAADKDQLKITFEGKIDGEPFPNGSGEAVPIVLGSGQMIPGFEQHLVGLRKDAETSFDVTFPDDYPATDLAGKTARFDVKVDEVAEPELPELNDEFFAAFGVNEGGLDAMKRLLRDNMTREVGERIETEVKNQVMEALLETNDISVPQALVKEEVDNLATNANLPTPADGGADNAAKLDEIKASLFGDDAERRVKLGLIVSRLISTHDIEISDDMLRERMMKMAASYDDKDEFVNWYRNNPQAMDSLRTLVLEEQVVNWLLEKAEVVDEAKSFDEFMRPPQANSTGASQ